MGIPRFMRSLGPYASISEIQGPAVIDGPALAYHILHIARLESGTKTAVDEPSYAVLGSTVIRWLDTLQSCGIQVTAIYFDGLLPAYKTIERLGRIRQSSATAHNYFLATSAGIPSEKGQFTSYNGRGEKFPSFDPTSKRRLYDLPVPAFLVPAVLDAVRSSNRYGPLTCLVSGEADPFCAWAVKQNGGIVLTSDSDLLLYDLGVDGKVVFLSDLNMHDPWPDSATQGVTSGQPKLISAPVRSQQAIFKQISPEFGLSDLLIFAHDLMTGSYLSLAEWAAQAKSQHSDYSHANEDLDRFIARFEGIPASDFGLSKRGCDSFLDPRIAEFVFSVGYDSIVDIFYPSDQPHKAPAFYLPQLLDRWDLRSAWITGVPIRALAYSVCCAASKSDIFVVVEYRRSLSDKPQGQGVNLLSGEEIAQCFEQVLSWILKFTKNTVPHQTRSKWIALCLSLEITDSNQEDTPSVALKAWRKAAKMAWRLDPGDWDSIHLVAHVQGTLYSLRMLQQVLKCWQAGLMRGAAGLNKTRVEEMLGCLSSLPPLAEYLCVSNISELFLELVTSGVAAEIEQWTGVSRPHLSGKCSKKRRQEQKKHSVPGPVMSMHTNPFELLDAE